MFSVTASWSKLYDGFPAVVRNQIPYGLSVGINKTLTDIQAAQRRGMQQRFTLRRASFVLGMVNIRKEDFATKKNLMGRVRVGEHTAAGSSHGKADFAASLIRHEGGGTFHDGYWIPTSSLRPNFAQLVPRKMQPTALGLWTTDRMYASLPTLRGGVRTGGARRKGNQRTFSIINRQGELVGIFQRFGLTNKQIRRRVKKGNAPSLAERQDEGIRMIWHRAQSIRFGPRLGFADTASLVSRMNMSRNVEDGIAKAIRTAKPGGGLKT